MAKILLFGSSTIFGVPAEIDNWLLQYKNQGHEFILGDKKGVEAAFHKSLSGIGALGQSTIYSMGQAYNNKFGIKNKIFDTYYDEESKTVQIVLRGDNEGSVDESFEPYSIAGVEKEMDIPHNKEWYEFKDKQMIRDCDIAIGVVDINDKVTTHIIQLLNIYNKPCYTTVIR